MPQDYKSGDVWTDYYAVKARNDMGYVPKSTFTTTFTTGFVPSFHPDPTENRLRTLENQLEWLQKRLKAAEDTVWSLDKRLEEAVFELNRRKSVDLRRDWADLLPGVPFPASKPQEMAMTWLDQRPSPYEVWFQSTIKYEFQSYKEKK